MSEKVTSRASFTVRASALQAVRWQAAADYEGARTVSAWLATLASARLREMGKWVPRMRLHWRRASFRIIERPHGEEEVAREVAGILAGPFGIHKDGGFHLVHAPTGRHLIELPTQVRCKRLARELAMCKVNWSATSPADVTGPEMARAQIALGTARCGDERLRRET